MYGISLVASITIAIMATACGKSTTKTERFEGTEWNVTVNKTVMLSDTVRGISTEYKYTVSDTAQVNAALKELPHCENVTIGWTIPSDDGSIWLVAYDEDPILSEQVTVTEANYMPSYGGNIQVGFKFQDAKKWESITSENIGKRLAVIVNDQLMNAPQVNSEITSGNCSVSIPAEMIHDYLPNLDLL